MVEKAETLPDLNSVVHLIAGFLKSQNLHKTFAALASETSLDLTASQPIQ